MTGDGVRTVLFLLPSLAGGGAERVFVTLVRHIDRARFRPVLAVLDARENAYRGDVPDDVELIDLGARRARYALPAIVRVVRRLRPAAVVSTLGHVNLTLALAQPLLPRGTRLIAREAVVHGRATPQAHWRLLYRLLHGRLDAIVCQSESMRRELRGAYGLSADDLRVIHNPVDATRIRRLAAEPLPPDARLLGADAPEIRLVAAGRMSHEKGFDVLLDAIALLHDLPLGLTLLGDGPLRADLERQAERLGLGARVHFAGFRPNPYAWFARASALVLSSRFEAFPNVVVEALAAGTPVIATPAEGGLAEIAACTGPVALADAVDAAALAAALRAFPYGTRPGPDAVAAFDAARVTRRYEALLDEGAR